MLSVSCWDHVSWMQIDAYVHVFQTESFTSVLTGHNHVLESTTDLLWRITVICRHFAAVSKHDKCILFYFGALLSNQLMLPATRERIYAMCYICARLFVSKISGDDTKMDCSTKGWNVRQFDQPTYWFHIFPLVYVI